MSNRKRRPIWARLKEEKQHSRELKEMVEQLGHELSMTKAMCEHYRASYESAMRINQTTMQSSTRLYEILTHSTPKSEKTW